MRLAAAAAPAAARRPAAAAPLPCRPFCGRACNKSSTGKKRDPLRQYKGWDVQARAR